MQMANTVAPLSATQERKLVEYLEEQFLELARGYKKRSIPRDPLYSPHELTYSLRLSGGTDHIPRVTSRHSRHTLKPHTTSLTLSFKYPLSNRQPL